MPLQAGPPRDDDATLAGLYRRHVYTLLSFIRRYVSTREDAEDVLLEVFLAALTHDSLAHVSEGEQLAWLRRVAHNKCVDVFRRAQRKTVVSLESVEGTLYEDEDRAPEQLALRSEEHAWLRTCLAHLSEQQQAALRLRFAEGLRCREIARRLHTSEGAVRMLLSRALNLLRETYQQQAKGDRQDEQARRTILP